MNLCIGKVIMQQTVYERFQSSHLFKVQYFLSLYYVNFSLKPVLTAIKINFHIPRKDNHKSFRNPSKRDDEKIKLNQRSV